MKVVVVAGLTSLTMEGDAPDSLIPNDMNLGLGIRPQPTMTEGVSCTEPQL
jgi:hypothetical protein